MKKILLFVALFFLNNISAQIFPGGNIKVIDNGVVLKNPWAGGLDLPQFSASDINSDGKKDLIIFDRKANKWLIYLNEGNSEFKYAPQYEKLYPQIINMGLIRDYNCDGLGDIFAHVNQGIQVFKNTNENGNPSFVQAKSILKYKIGALTNNIYKYNSDIAAIDDFDGDGDMDILSFDLLGTTIPYYRNLSVENGFGCDSLIFEENTVCWGNFREGGLDNTIELNFACKGSSGEDIVIPQNANRHTGSTLTVLDHDEDNDKDLLLGDVAYNNLVYLKNGGTNFTANMISAELDFPSYDTSVNVPIFPAAFYLDVTGDGKDDLLVAPNSETSSVNKECVWLFENTGNSAKRFQLKQKDFLVKSQIDYGSYSFPTFFDQNADGLLDLIIGNGYVYDEFGTTNSSLYYYENTGTLSNPEFTFVTDNYQLIGNFGREFIRPTFGDIDADGDDDMIIGESNGGMHFFENTAGAGNPAAFVLNTPNYFGLDIGTFSHPVLVDLDLDGLLDLVVGRNAPAGNVAYFRNFGTASVAAFHPDSSNQILGGIHVENPGFLFGYSAPFITDVDVSGKRYIYVGSDLGNVHKYEINQDSLESGLFEELQTSILETSVGIRSTISIVDINNDGVSDYFFGNARGGISFYSDVLLDTTLTLAIKNTLQNELVFNMYPNPAESLVTLSFDNLSREYVNIEILDILGKIYYQNNFNGSQFSINTSNFSKGVYFVSLNSGSKKAVKKLIIQ